MYKRHKGGISADEVKQQAAGRWADILPSVCGLTRGQLDPSLHGPCPKCNGADRYRAFDNVAETGGLICNQRHNGNTSPKNCDGLAAVMWLNGVDFKKALRMVADNLGIQPTDQKQPTAAAPPKAADIHDGRLADALKLCGERVARNRGAT